MEPWVFAILASMAHCLNIKASLNVRLARSFSRFELYYCDWLPLAKTFAGLRQHKGRFHQKTNLLSLSIKVTVDDESASQDLTGLVA